MLIAIFSYFFLSGVDEESFVKLTKDYAQSQSIERQQMLNQHVKNMETDLQVYLDISKEAAETIKDSELTREELKAKLVSFNDKREATLQNFFDTRYKIKDELSQEEWEEAFN